MPSPLAHAAMGYAVYRIAQPYMPLEAPARVGVIPLLLVATVGLSLLPDSDAIIGLLAGNVGRYHNAIASSLFSGAAVALAVGALAWSVQRSAAKRWFLLALVCFYVHLLMDFATVGRGIMLFWPITSDRFHSPVSLFYGLHWSQGLWSTQHVITLFTEAAFATVVMLVTHVLVRRSREVS